MPNSVGLFVFYPHLQARTKDPEFLLYSMSAAGVEFRPYRPFSHFSSLPGFLSSTGQNHVISPESRCKEDRRILTMLPAFMHLCLLSRSHLHNSFFAHCPIPLPYAA